MEIQTDQFGTDGISVPAPRWIAESLVVKEGRDPLGFQTTTQDRLMPFLLPGILELSRRARYISFHAFLLDEYRQKRMPADGNSLSSFIKRREWDLGLAVHRCPKKCGSSPVGARRLGNLTTGPGPFPRRESVESAFGGYGLYYRSPMAMLGIVAKAGTLLGDQPIPIDVLYTTDRASRLVEGFRSAVEQTAYYQHWMWTDNELPIEVVDEYAAVACLCRLRELSSERDAVHDALFGSDPPPKQPNDDGDPAERSLETFSEADVLQRRRSFGHYLALVDAHSDVIGSESAFRSALWSPPHLRSDNHSLLAGQWAGLIAKDVWQEVICSVWSEFCRTGLARTRDIGRGITWDETRNLTTSMVVGPPKFDSHESTGDLVSALAAGSLTIPDEEGELIEIAGASLEKLRLLTVHLDSATSGLIVILELARRANERSDVGWRQASARSSAWQPSVAEVLKDLRTHLEEAPTVGDSLWWMVSNFIIPVHERISYSKLPEFTFRFRWEDGLLRFYDQGVGRFPLAAIRNEPLASLTLDLGLWRAQSTGDASGELTARGKAFMDEALT